MNEKSKVPFLEAKRPLQTAVSVRYKIDLAERLWLLFFRFEVKPIKNYLYILKRKGISFSLFSLESDSHLTIEDFKFQLKILR